MMSWSPQDIPDQQARTVVITGANSGIGFETALALADKGARVVMACRNPTKAEAARERIREQTGGRGEVQIVALDLASLDSVRRAADTLRERYSRLDLLINNAGVMWLRQGHTEDGFERQLGVNHLGHFALTGLLLPALREVPDSRIVTVSSLAHKAGRLHLDNLQLDGRYGRQRAYAQAKLANLVFALELERRLRATEAETLSVACHPGLASTNLAESGVARESPFGVGYVARWLWPLFTQSAARGAAPTLYAATSPQVQGGGYYGPAYLREAVGPPTLVHPSQRARDAADAARLWEQSEALTGVRYP
ncbi:short chain dehydrogenase [Alcanivorax xiamenensis]|uniref:Short chain dehydrogenase n=1 Tax=Alcanivorax xiamenensis TaxID=1177156 RepID=A0ABQ6Y7R9_9GAMM|nr:MULTISPECIES: oxidoreductase [Alcanivorax]KAF0805550.1 short chain dehydrogenase [Alcanivorax xiamenensis]